MKPYTHLLSTLLVLVLVIGCSSQGENISNLEERLENFLANETPIIVKGEPFTGVAFQEWDNGQIKIEIHLENGIPNGLSEAYYENGQLRSKGTFKDGRLEGISEVYYENGQLEAKETYKDGNLDGPYELYHENGQLWMKGTIKNGERDGPYELYRDNGQLAIKGTYKEGRQDGQWEYYNTDGVMVELTSTEVFNPYTGVIWMDRNLGANRVALQRDDSESYGSYFTFDEALEACPNGYRLPTEAEWVDELQSWSSNSSVGAFASPLKLTAAGYLRDSSGSLHHVGTNGYYWSGTVSGSDARNLSFGSSLAHIGRSSLTLGNSVRCLKN